MQNSVWRAGWTSAIACALLSSMSIPANALTISAEFDLGNSSIANPVTAINPNKIALDLTTGDVIALEVIVENEQRDLVTAIFATLETDDLQLSFLGGAFYDILTEDSCVGSPCTPAALRAGIAAPIGKMDAGSNATGTTDWTQAIAHVNPAGAMGAGPDRAVLLAYQYRGLGGFERVDIVARLTAGDAVAGDVGQVDFRSAAINVPEPTTGLLLGLGMLGLGRTRRSR